MREGKPKRYTVTGDSQRAGLPDRKSKRIIVSCFFFFFFEDATAPISELISE